MPVFAPINPIGTAPAQEACLKLTEDEKVFAAVGFFYFDAPLCYVSQHDTPILGGTMNPDVPEAGEGAVDDPRVRSGGDASGGRRAR